MKQTLTCCKFWNNEEDDAPNSVYFITGGSDSMISLYRITPRVDFTPVHIHDFPRSQQGEAILDCAFNSTGNRICSVGRDRAISILDVFAGVTLRRMFGHESQVNACEFAPGTLQAAARPNLLLTGSADSTARLWDLRTKTSLVQTLPRFQDSVTGVAFGRDAELIACSASGAIKFFDVRTARGILQQTHASIASMAYSVYNQVLAVALLDESEMSSIKILKQNGGENSARMRTPNKHKLRVPLCLFGQKGAEDFYCCAAGGSEDGSVQIWRPSSAQAQILPMLPNLPVLGLAAHQSTRSILACGPNGLLKVVACNPG